MSNEQELRRFIKKLLSYNSSEKAEISLKQLKNILETNNISKQDNEFDNLIKVIDLALDNLPDFIGVATQNTIDEPFSDEKVKIALRRAEERKRREAEMGIWGRC